MVRNLSKKITYNKIANSLKKGGIMKTGLKIIMCAVLFLAMLRISYAQTANEGKVITDGDVIFIKNKTLGGNSLLPNGKTQFNYVGVIFIEDGIPMVYHATEPISKCSLKEFIGKSHGGDYKIRRLYDPSVLTDDVIGTMHTFAKAKLGEHYDNSLNLNNEQLYNAEFVYKMYQNALGILLVDPRPLSEYKNDATSLEFLKEAYGDDIMNEKMVVVGDIYHSKYME